ncbi:hypothetical protein [Sigmofec virus UA08Rod_5667]|uniref:Uncharacterized protein n=1 Tax=Sigmofec virus UA08Rod_5667 TaxID=2929435 RepID=A0A976N211_9VIRU|nr:hypothetical protein [Sigmofec virus UA08Rod_5667]
MSFKYRHRRDSPWSVLVCDFKNGLDFSIKRCYNGSRRECIHFLESHAEELKGMRCFLCESRLCYFPFGGVNY